MNVLDIITAYLREHGYDGLYESYGECACKVDDLAPCIESLSNCQPGYLAPCPADCGCGSFHMQEEKP